MKTAIFSNGHADTYKGVRDVKAAWMVTEIKTGKVIASGHSLTAQNAEKTARSYMVSQILPAGWKRWRKDVRASFYAKDRGYESVGEMEAAISKANAEYASRLTIEIINI